MKRRPPLAAQGSGGEKPLGLLAPHPDLVLLLDALVDVLPSDIKPGPLRRPLSLEQATSQSEAARGGPRRPPLQVPPRRYCLCAQHVTPASFIIRATPTASTRTPQRLRGHPAALSAHTLIRNLGRPRTNMRLSVSQACSVRPVHAVQAHHSTLRHRQPLNDHAGAERVARGTLAGSQLSQLLNMHAATPMRYCLAHRWLQVPRRGGWRRRQAGNGRRPAACRRGGRTGRSMRTATTPCLTTRRTGSRRWVRAGHWALCPPLCWQAVL